MNFQFLFLHLLLISVVDVKVTYVKESRRGGLRISASAKENK